MSDARNHAATTRRHLLSAGTMAVVAAVAARPGIAFGSARAEARPTLPHSLQHAQMDAWTSAVGETFLVRETGQMLKLVEVKAFARSGARPSSLPRSGAFAAVFETGARDSGTPEGVYRLAHRAIAPMPVHLAPVTKAGRRQRLIAVFN